MLRDDMLMRQIRKMMDAILRAVKLKRAKDLPAAEQTLDDMLQGALGLSPAMVRALDANTLLGMLSPAGELDRERATALGLVLAAQARVVESREVRDKALAVLEAAGLDDAARLVDDEDALERYAQEHAEE